MTSATSTRRRPGSQLSRRASGKYNGCGGIVGVALGVSVAVDVSSTVGDAVAAVGDGAWAAVAVWDGVGPLAGGEQSVSKSPSTIVYWG